MVQLSQRENQILNQLGWFEYVLVHYRWVFVCFFLLPLSLLYECYFYLRNWLIFKLSSAPSKHNAKVRDIQAQVRAWNSGGRKQKMCTGRPGWLTMCFRQPTYKNTLTKINIDLLDVLEVNTDRKTVRVEPLVTMGQITATLLPLGWTIPVVPELDDLTIGGLINGAGIETSSHIHGLFQHICVSFELVMADGSLIKCSKDENSDLFYCVPWSHGTLGFLVAAEIKIISVKPFVKMTYLPCHSLQETVSVFEREVQRKDENEFVEGICYSLESAVVMKACFTDAPEPEKINEIGKFYKPWFFEHVRSFLKKVNSNSQPFVEYLPIRHYYHRHSKSIFWEIEPIIPFGNNFLFRYLVGWAIPPKVSFLKLTQTQGTKKLYEATCALQDLLIPLKSMEEGLVKMHEELELYPIWLCPFNLPGLPGLVHPAGSADELYVDIGLYGRPVNPKFDPRESIRSLEKYVRQVHGYMTKEEFRTMFDHSLFDQVRQKYECEAAFPDIYEKVNRNSRT